MKTIILALFVCISVSAFGVAYVPPNIYAKQYLAELALKETLIKVWSNKANCLANLNRQIPVGGPTNGSQWLGTLQRITEGADTVITVGKFKESNIHVVKMALTGDSTDPKNDMDRLFTVYYKRDGLESYKLNTIDNKICSSANQDGCYKAQCSLELDKTPLNEKCKFSSCCSNCWSITGGL